MASLPKKDSTPLTTYEGRDFLHQEEFKGTIIKVNRLNTKLARPFHESELIRVVIRDNDGGIHIIKQFPTGKHATGELDGLPFEGEVLLPYRLFLLRDTIGFD